MEYFRLLAFVVIISYSCFITQSIFFAKTAATL